MVLYRPEVQRLSIISGCDRANPKVKILEITCCVAHAPLTGIGHCICALSSGYDNIALCWNFHFENHITFHLYTTSWNYLYILYISYSYNTHSKGPPFLAL